MDTDTNIGKKIQSARKEAGLTQEQAAELIGVSRQTISNWETENSYPSIISVIKMSDAYHVSLDYLLKGEPAMNKYYEYLKESTDVVESNTRKGKLLTVLIYLIIWAFAMIFFWFFTSGSDAMGYSLMFLWIILPVTTFVISLVIGIKDYWGRKKWLASPILGIMYMLAEYGTYSTANNMAFHKINSPEWKMMITGTVISLIALALGHLIGKRRQKHIS
ncbi:MAG: helix-turn-helix transcriptional regulator [Eubacteriaceae bacterium]|nr:helix-turn-helix transcriptional regulator [Eubacteriaceae bacterium]